MEYHRDRFEDYSLMFYQDNELLALLPAHRIGTALFSHQGMTFGGWVCSVEMEENKFCQLVHATIDHLKQEGIQSLLLRPMPEFYSDTPCTSLALLAQLGFKTIGESSTYVLPLPAQVQDRGKRWGARKAANLGVRIVETAYFEQFWTELLVPYHQEKVGRPPVHRLDEINYLAARHPGAITQLHAYLGDELLAGICLFDFHQVRKIQYTASTARGREIRAVDLLLQELIQRTAQPYIDMGAVLDPTTGKEKSSLRRWKESWGAKRTALPLFQWVD